MGIKLGLDVGTTFVGVALSDPTLTLALPQGTLLRTDCYFAKLRQE